MCVWCVVWGPKAMLLVASWGLMAPGVLLFLLFWDHAGPTIKVCGVPGAVLLAVFELLSVSPWLLGALGSYSLFGLTQVHSVQDLIYL